MVDDVRLLGLGLGPGPGLGLGLGLDHGLGLGRVTPHDMFSPPHYVVPLFRRTRQGMNA
jgi:hypothetical protein